MTKATDLKTIILKSPWKMYKRVIIWYLIKTFVCPFLAIFQPLSTQTIKVFGLINFSMSRLWEIRQLTCISTPYHRPYPKRQLPKGIFPSGIFPNVQFPKRQLPKCTFSQMYIFPKCTFSQMKISQMVTSPWRKSDNFPNVHFTKQQFPSIIYYSFSPSRSARPPSPS